MKRNNNGFVFPTSCGIQYEGMVLHELFYLEAVKMLFPIALKENGFSTALENVPHDAKMLADAMIKGLEQ